MAMGIMFIMGMLFIIGIGLAFIAVFSWVVMRLLEGTITIAFIEFN